MPTGTLIFISISGVFVGFIAIAILISAVKRARHQRSQQEYAEKYHAKAQSAQSAKSKQARVASAPKEWSQNVRDKHQIDADRHEHLGEEEHYEEIVGSLGEVNDEGCEDLSGVRFIAHDMAYEINDEHADYSKVAQAMVLGEILNQPRFKKPYSHK